MAAKRFKLTRRELYITNLLGYYGAMSISANYMGGDQETCTAITNLDDAMLHLETNSIRKDSNGAISLAAMCEQNFEDYVPEYILNKTGISREELKAYSWRMYQLIGHKTDNVYIRP